MTLKKSLLTFCLAFVAYIASAGPIIIGGSQTSPSCPGACDGSITLNVSGGTAPYSYQWNNGATTSALTGLCADTFTVVVTDFAGATASQTRIIRNPYPVRANFTRTNVTCYGACNGTITVSPYGGSAPYTYMWNNGATTAMINGLCPGTYIVTVTDSKGCTYVCNESIIQPATLVTGQSVGNATCSGNCDGNASVNASGGTTPYSYAWSNGATTAAVNNLCPGNYSCIISDANGCTAVENVEVTGQAPLVPACSVLSNESYVGASDGSLNATANGGAQPYSYLWSNGATTAQINGLAAGTYTVTITDNSGCSASTSCQITAPQNCGGFRTQTQGGWGQCQTKGNNPGTYLRNNFAAAFPNGLTVGCNYTLSLNSVAAVCTFLPSGSTPRALTANLTNPSNYNNVLAGQVVALTLNVRFDAYDASFGSSGTSLGNQVIVSGAFAGWSVQQLLDTANRVLGGCASQYSASAINNAVSSVNENYVDGSTDQGFLTCPGSGNRVTAQKATEALVYPNPFRNEVTIRIADERSAVLNLMDMSGKSLRQFNINGGSFTISEELKPGAYLLNIQYNDGQTEIVKLLKTN